MGYDQRPGRIEGFDYFAVFAIVFLAIAAAHVGGVINGLSFDIPRFDLRSQAAAWATGERRAAPVERVAARDRSHRVRKGETLSRIARRYGIQLSELVELNGIEGGAAIEVGDVLRVPPREARLRRTEAIGLAQAPAADFNFRELLERLISGELLIGEPPIADVPAAEAPATETARAVAAPAAPVEPADSHATVDRLLAMAESDLYAARFDEAAIAAQAALRYLDQNPEISSLLERRAKVEITLATIYTALGEETEAQQSFERALRADPAFTLDPAETSPKVIAGLEAARSRRPQ